MSTENLTIVLDFLKKFGSDNEGMAQAIGEYFTDDGVYELIGFPKAESKAKVLELFALMGPIFEMTRLDIEVRNATAAGDVVMVERWDEAYNARGDTILTREPVVGVFELRKGQIAAWRDYFDPRQFGELFERRMAEMG